MNRSIELGNELDLSPDRKVASLKSLVLEYADLSRTFDSTFNSLRLCDSPYTSSQVTGMVQTSISRIKKSNDEFVRQIAALNREQEKANRDKVISKQNSMLSEKDSLLKSLTSQFSAFALDYERITKTQTRQTSGISFGSKVDQKRANADLEKKRTENQSAISQYRARMNELDKEMGLTEAEKNATPDKSLKSFLDKYLKKLEQIRSMIFKILMTLLNFDKYYLGRLS
jgi:hypothetical protein